MVAAIVRAGLAHSDRDPLPVWLAVLFATLFVGLAAVHIWFRIGESRHWWPVTLDPCVVFTFSGDTVRSRRRSVSAHWLRSELWTWCSGRLHQLFRGHTCRSHRHGRRWGVVV